jgi:glyoxylase-like metal-dependent hydrolase (beta-lactamase superfamily II)
VYVLRSGESGLLIDLGDGSVVPRLSEIGVRQIEWVLLTHHHREQVQGYPALQGNGAKIGAPEAERDLLQQPQSWRKVRAALSDRYTVHGASYVRPPVNPVRIDRGFKALDDFEWRGFSFHCIETKGNSPGGMSYFLKHGDKWIVFSGDVMMDGAGMHTWFDSEWDYGFAAGIYALEASASFIASYDPMLLLPSHGPVIGNAKRQLSEFGGKLKQLEKLYLRGYPVMTFGGGQIDLVSKPTAVPHIWRVTPHLYKFNGPNFTPNFYLLMADSGRALVVDCGVNPATLDPALERMQKQFGLRGIDACILTHMHGDHMLEAEHLRKKWGAQVWALNNMVEKCEHPERFDYAAAVQTYRKDLDGVHIDRAFRPGEALDWEGYHLTVDWMPGQTEFALALRGIIDGKKVIFTGDNVFGNPADPQQNGHEAVVARNSSILEEGYIYGSEYLLGQRPDLVAAGHSIVFSNPMPMLRRFRDWSYQMRAAFQSLSSEEDYRYWYDPYWVRAEPYRLKLRRGESADFKLHVRNFRETTQTHRIEIHAPAGLSAVTPVLEGRLDASKRGEFPMRLAAESNASPGVAIVAFDITLGGRRYGERFDMIVEVQ